MRYFTFTAGRLRWNTIRNFLDGCKFKEMDICYMETNGFLSHDFIVKGSDDDILIVQNTLVQFDNDNADTK